MAEVMETFDVDVVCPTCSERRYTSVRPLGLKETLSASLFKPVGDAPPMIDGQPLICHACNSLMKFMKSVGSRAPLPSRTEMMESRQQATPAPSPIETLFEVKQGEDVKQINETPYGMVIVTNKRIVRINL